MQLLFLSLITIFLYTAYIRFFKRLGQYEREEGLASHKNKTGTITMGGIIFVIIPLFFIMYDQKTMSIAVTIFLYGVLGFVDDLLIIIKKDNRGVPPTIKLVLQVMIAAISFALYLYSGMDTVLHIFGIGINIKWIYGLLLLLILTSATNAFNITDGVDGLCSGLCILLSLAFLYISYKKEEYTIFYMILCFMIPLFIFWCFNYPKAFLFMGDTGSLFLGAFYAMLSIYLDCLIPFLIMAGLFIFETLSVILQVWYYKKTSGKRIFKMAPFHHHLEACGYKEIKVDIIFYIIQIGLIIVGLLFV